MTSAPDETMRSFPDSAEPLPYADRILEHRDGLLRFIRSRGVGEADAEDVLQDSLLKALRGAPKLEDEERFAGWLFQIVRNAIADHFRRAGRNAVDVDPEVRVGPASEEDHRMICRCVEGLIPTLTPGYGELIEHIDLGGESHASAAARLGITRENVKVRLHRARRQLRERIEETCRSCAEHGCLDCACRAVPTKSPERDAF